MNIVELNRELNCWENFLDSFAKILKRSVKIGDFPIEMAIKQNIEDAKKKINDLLCEWRKDFPEDPWSIVNLSADVYADLIASIARDPVRIIGNETKLAALFIFCVQRNLKMEMYYMGNFKKIFYLRK